MKKDDKLFEITNALLLSPFPSSINNDLDETTEAIGHFPMLSHTGILRNLFFEKTLLKKMKKWRKFCDRISPF